jgi:hypothetical protein
VVALALVACGGQGAVPAPTIPSDALPGLASRVTGLDTAKLAEDALDPGALQDLLGRAGFVAGAERSLTTGTAGFRSLAERRLSFGSPEGAKQYLDWLAHHASDILGAEEPEPPFDLPGSLAFSEEPGGCCPEKSTFWFLTAWQRGGTVLSVMASGPDAKRDNVAPFVASLDAAVERTEG